MPDPDPGPILPLGLRLRGRRCLVVGGGVLAHRRIAGLLEVGALVTVISRELTPALEALATAGALRWEPRTFASEDLAEAWYVVAASGSAEIDRRVAAEAEAARILCSVGADLAAGSAAVPAIGRHGGYTIGVHSAPDEPTEDDGIAEAALRDAIIAALLEGRIGARTNRSGEPGVALVGGGPGEPGLLTLRGRQLLVDADVVIADHLAPQSFLASLPDKVLVIDASKLPTGRAMGQLQINDLLVEHARAGRRVVRLKGGDPFVFGRGMEEVQACVAAGVAVEVVPGVTSAIAVPAMAGIPVTHRGLAHEFVVVSGHLPPGHPESLVDWPALGRLRGTIVVLMGVHTAGAIATALIGYGRSPATPVAAIGNGGLPGERILRMSLVDVAAVLAEQDLRPPAVLVIGAVAALASSSSAAAASASGRE